MKIVRLMGGLGNQMFQYAFGQALANHYQEEVKYDYGLLLNRSEPHEIVTHRNPELEQIFNLSLNIAGDEEIKPFSGSHSINLFDRIKNRLLWEFAKNKMFIESGRHFHSEVFNLPDKVCYVGGWQSEKYFISIADKLRNDFKFRFELLEASKKFIASLSELDNAVCIHVRRGDYVTSPLYAKTIGTLPDHYYHKAISTFGNYSQLVVFSDDLEYCKNLFANYPNVVFAGDEHVGQNAHNYFQLMTRFSNFILSNSTFSWWAAWLSSGNNKKVVAPFRWFKSSDLNGKDIVPDSWMKIEF